jgi:hypothetical protein
MKRAADTLAALADRLVGQADNGEDRPAGRDLHLDVDGHGLDALERNRRDVRNHRAQPLPAFEPSARLRVGQEQFVNM